ncbi:MAG TPA: acyl-CoA dehydrogenase family protein [Vicinamibacteria bacterium]
MSKQNWIVSQDILDRCHERASVYDRENRFCQEDFDELRRIGYLKMAVPKELGGLGLNLAESCRETRRLAYHAPATALCINMHTYWCGVASELWKRGDKSLEWLLKEAAQGEVFAAGHAESGNDIPVLLTTSKAERVSGGYKFTGRKSFGSLSPVWTRLGLHGMDTSDPAHPKVVHVFMPRDTKGYKIEETWDTLGMRATRSDDTVLDGCFVPDKYIARVVAPGPAGLDLFVLSIFAWGLVAFGNVYCGLAQRVRDITLDMLKKKKSIAVTRTMAYHPEAQHGVAEMVMALETVEPLLDRVAEEWAEGRDYGPGWVLKIVTAKYQAVEAAFRVADTALDLSGGYGMFKKSELERLFRDSRAGRFHPANSALTHELVAKLSLGIDPAESPRWG